ncbi:MAG: SDR family NAD(P)-dependent oxidoreductase, partial [Polyangiales bacterium]
MRVSAGNVIVTGATRGIGRATVEAILERGGRVVGVARNVDALAALEALHPNRFRGVSARLEDFDQLHAVVDRAREARGTIDGLV